MTLTAEMVERRHSTIVDAFLTEDRRRRDYLQGKSLWPWLMVSQPTHVAPPRVGFPLNPP